MSGLPFFSPNPSVACQTSMSIGRCHNKQQEICYMHFPTGRTAHSTAFDGPVVDHWLEWKIAQTANVTAA